MIFNVLLRILELTYLYLGLYERVRPLLHNRGLIFEIRFKIALFRASERCPFFDYLRFRFCLVHHVHVVSACRETGNFVRGWNTLSALIWKGYCSYPRAPWSKQLMLSERPTQEVFFDIFFENVLQV